MLAHSIDGMMADGTSHSKEIQGGPLALALSRSRDGRPLIFALCFSIFCGKLKTKKGPGANSMIREGTISGRRVLSVSAVLSVSV